MSPWMSAGEIRRRLHLHLLVQEMDGPVRIACVEGRPDGQRALRVAGAPVEGEEGDGCEGHRDARPPSRPSPRRSGGKVAVCAPWFCALPHSCGGGLMVIASQPEGGDHG